jgi:hypothetical protein
VDVRAGNSTHKPLRNVLGRRPRLASVGGDVGDGAPEERGPTATPLFGVSTDSATAKIMLNPPPWATNVWLRVCVRVSRRNAPSPSSPLMPPVMIAVVLLRAATPPKMPETVGPCCTHEGIPSTCRKLFKSFAARKAIELRKPTRATLPNTTVHHTSRRARRRQPHCLARAPSLSSSHRVTFTGYMSERTSRIDCDESIQLDIVKLCDIQYNRAKTSRRRVDQ